MGRSGAHRDNQARNRGRVLWSEQKVDMVGRQDVRMKLAVLALQSLAQPAKVGVAILVIEEAGPAEEAGLAIVATRYDVQRDTVDVNA